MKITVNQKEIQFPAAILTLAQLAEELNLQPSGVAIAVNSKVVRKTSWGITHLSDGDKVTIITAVCGG